MREDLEHTYTPGPSLSVEPGNSAIFISGMFGDFEGFGPFGLRGEFPKGWFLSGYAMNSEDCNI